MIRFMMQRYIKLYYNTTFMSNKMIVDPISHLG